MTMTSTSTSSNSLKALNREQGQLVSRSDSFLVAPEALLEEEGFNIRGAFFGDDYYEQPEVKAHIRQLADAYLRGDYVPPVVVKVKNGKVYIRDGHHRRRALLLAISEGAEIKKVLVLEHRGDEADQTLFIATSNDGAPLRTLERAVIYGRLAAWGWTAAEIAARVGRTVTHVNNLLEMLEMPMELKAMVQRDVMSATYALELYREHGEKSVELVKAKSQELNSNSKEEAENSPKAKITKKNLETGPKIGKKLAISMRNTILQLKDSFGEAKKTQGGNYQLTISPQQLEAMLQLAKSLSESEITTQSDDKTQDRKKA